jgi:hypothetical protein
MRHNIRAVMANTALKVLGFEPVFGYISKPTGVVMDR